VNPRRVAVDVVADDAHVVGRGRPGQVHDPAADRRLEFVGAVGGVVSETTTALASFEGGPTLPAASSAVTL
jgi:hypothetical protein